LGLPKLKVNSDEPDLTEMMLMREKTTGHQFLEKIMKNPKEIQGVLTQKSINLARQVEWTLKKIENLEEEDI